jgi:hypothetical protein
MADEPPNQIPDWVKIIGPMFLIAAGWAWYAGSIISEFRAKLDDVQRDVAGIEALQDDRAKLVERFRDAFADMMRRDDRQDTDIDRLLEEIYGHRGEGAQFGSQSRRPKR